MTRAALRLGFIRFDDFGFDLRGDDTAKLFTTGILRAALGAVGKPGIFGKFGKFGKFGRGGSVSPERLSTMFGTLSNRSGALRRTRSMPLKTAFVISTPFDPRFRDGL